MENATFEFILLIISFAACFVGLMITAYSSFFIKKRATKIREILSSIEVNDNSEIKILLYFPTDDMFNRVIFMNKLSALIGRKKLKDEINSKFPPELLKRIKRLSISTWICGVVCFGIAIPFYYFH